MDYTGSMVPPASLISDGHELLRELVLGNPHSHNAASCRASGLVEQGRRDTLEFVGASEENYMCAFTNNATHAIKLIAESFPYDPETAIVILSDNHNSCHGIREFAARAGASVFYVPLEADLTVKTETLHAILQSCAAKMSRGLFVYPAQSNFSGVLHPLSWIKDAQDLGFQVLLDTAAYLPAHQFQCDVWQPDYIVGSYYKLFGYPTGIGCLIAKKSAAATLKRPWYAGGNVQFASVLVHHHLLERDATAFEDGTVSFLTIPLISLGLKYMQSIGLNVIEEHNRVLMLQLEEGLQQIKHSNGKSLLALYGPRAETGMRGSALACNFTYNTGKVINCYLVEQCAMKSNISIRSGMFCNPGCGERALEYDEATEVACFKNISSLAFSIPEFSKCMNNSPGAVRISVGFPTTSAEIEQFVNFSKTMVDFEDEDSLCFKWELNWRK